MNELKVKLFGQREQCFKIKEVGVKKKVFVNIKELL